MSIGSAAPAANQNQVFAATNGQTTRTGSVSSSQYGDGTFESILSIQNNVKTINTTVTYSSGTVINTQVTDTKNADGSETIDKTITGPGGETTTRDKTINADGSETVAITKTGADGKTTTIDRTITNSDGTETIDSVKTLANGKQVNRDETITTNSDGSKSLSGTITQADGSVVTLTGSITQTPDGTDESVIKTNAEGQMATSTYDVIKQGHNTTYDRSHTTFSGKSYSSSTTWYGSHPFHA